MSVGQELLLILWCIAGCLLAMWYLIEYRDFDFPHWRQDALIGVLSGPVAWICFFVYLVGTRISKVVKKFWKFLESKP